jgi:glutaredoxin
LGKRNFLFVLQGWRQMIFQVSRSDYRRAGFLLLCLATFFSTAQMQAQAQVDGNPGPHNVVIQLFYRGDSDQSLKGKEFLEQLRQRRPGIDVKAYDVLEDRAQLKRLWQLSKQFGHESGRAPTFHLCNNLLVGFRGAQTTGAQIEELLNIRAYIRPGCKHCKAGKAFLDEMIVRRPAIKVYYYDVVGDLNARQEVQNLAARYQVQIPSFPCVRVAGRLVVGYQTDETTGKKIEDFFIDRSYSTPVPEKTTPSLTPGRDEPEVDANQSKSKTGAAGSGLRLSLITHSLNSRTSYLFLSFDQDTTADPQIGRLKKTISDTTLPQQEDPELPEEVPLPDEFELPAEAEFPADMDDELIVFSSDSSTVDPENVEIPFFGKLSLSRLGLPTFTFMIGLVDGFNPCAMWVLVFLLSVLVNIKERKKILLVAGTFVIVSGLAYFTFMAAWFNVFQLIGLLRPVQIGLGITAIIVGAINVKDFFAFHQGVTLSIPESAKPGIYRRVRQIVSAKHMTTALCAAVVLAIVVNIVELLCTAGLPALYTEVLTMQKLPTWANYSYLALYISAYMLDDAILVGIVVVTLSHRRLQESEGRWLKLLSGVVILLLGAVMIIRPDLLV